MGALIQLNLPSPPRPVVEQKGFTIIQLPDAGFVPANASARFGGSSEQMLDANVVMSPVNWIARNFTEAEAVVESRSKELWTRDDDHPLTLLLARPNPFYGDTLLMRATVVSYCLDGNAYWQKVRNRFGAVLGFWYLPHFLVEPVRRPESDAFIDFYRYRPHSGGIHIDLPVRDVVHLRFGLDPKNPQLGLSPVKPLLREVYTDEEAATFSAAILGNMGVPGGVIAPKAKDALPTQADVQKMKEHMQGFTGSRRGEWLVLGTPTEISQFGFDPNNLTLGNLRDIAEERVCAALGVPAAVVGFGSGLQQTKVGATMRELRREAWDSCIRPMQNDMGKQLTMQVLPDFVTQTRRFRIRFDASAFAASQEQEGEKATRAATLVTAGILRVDRAQRMLGLEVDSTQEVYLRPSGTKAVKDAGLEPEGAGSEPVPAAIAARMRGGNGNGSNEE